MVYPVPFNSQISTQYNIQQAVLYSYVKTPYIKLHVIGSNNFNYNKSELLFHTLLTILCPPDYAVTVTQGVCVVWELFSKGRGVALLFIFPLFSRHKSIIHLQIKHLDPFGATFVGDLT